MGDDYSRIPIDPDLAPSDPGEPRVSPPRLRPTTRTGRMQPDVLAAIALGGMLGASARYGVARWVPAHSNSFPWATFWTNLCGCFVLGVVLVLLLERFPPTRLVRPFLTTGVLGAFTTMSTYQVETALLIKNHHGMTAALYGLGSLGAGVALAYAGIVTGRRATPRRSASG
jgi:CrcB protein